MTLTDQTWTDNKDRPVWVRGHRDELDALTGDDAEPVPDSMAAVRDWVSRYDGQISKQLQGAEGSDES